MEYLGCHLIITPKIVDDNKYELVLKGRQTCILIIFRFQTKRMNPKPSTVQPS